MRAMQCRLSPQVTALSLALLAGLAACQRPATNANAPAAASTESASSAPAAGTVATAPTKAPTDLEQLAGRVVKQSAGVQEGEVVLINGQPTDAELLEDLAVNVRKAGAFPIVTYGSDRLDKRMFFDVPPQYDAQQDKAAMGLAGLADVLININNSTAEDVLAGADPARMAARAKAGEAVNQATLRRGVRTVELGNNLYPTPWRAQRYGMSADDLSRLFWNGVNMDYAALQAHGEKVKAALAAGDEVHVTNANGTDLKLRIKGRPVLVSDGVLSEAERKAGGAAASVYLPAGEVYTTPVPGSAEGKVVQTHTFFRGKPIDNLTLTVSGGKVTAMSGSGDGWADYKAAYDATTDARKDAFGFIDLGINPNVKLPANSTIGTWVPAGTVTVGAGNNSWAGGDNTVPWGSTLFLPGSTVTLDGKTIVENGTLKL
jgi:leucyl aminopeptidase (aminopeptidase T)